MLILMFEFSTPPAPLLGISVAAPSGGLITICRPRKSWTAQGPRVGFEGTRNRCQVEAKQLWLEEGGGAAWDPYSCQLEFRKGRHVGYKYKLKLCLVNISISVTEIISSNINSVRKVYNSI